MVEDFGDEWSKFHQFDAEEIDRIGDMYFDIVDESILSADAKVIDIGCGTGRWSKYIAQKVGSVDAVDPSKAILVADRLLADNTNVRLSMASVDTLPFDEGTFDFGMSIGVLHHIPDTPKALSDCVKKIRIGGHFFVYLYYDLDDRGVPFRVLFNVVDLFRKGISRLPKKLKGWVCDLIALTVYLPLAMAGKLLRLLGASALAKRLPLDIYQDTSFFVMRNDALDRFGTRLEQRFSKSEVIAMMKKSGLDDIVVSSGSPYWHAIGKRVS